MALDEADDWTVPQDDWAVPAEPPTPPEFSPGLFGWAARKVGLPQDGGAVGRVLSEGGRAAVEGFGDQPLGLNDRASEALTGAVGMKDGPLNPARSLRGLAAIGDTAIRGLGAAYRGAQGIITRAGQEIGGDTGRQVARDIASVPDAFMAGLPMSRFNRAASEPRPTAPRPILAPPERPPGSPLTAEGLFTPDVPAGPLPTAPLPRHPAVIQQATGIGFAEAQAVHLREVAQWEARTGRQWTGYADAEPPPPPAAPPAPLTPGVEFPRTQSQIMAADDLSFQAAYLQMQREIAAWEQATGQKWTTDGASGGATGGGAGSASPAPRPLMSAPDPLADAGPSGVAQPPPPGTAPASGSGPQATTIFSADPPGTAPRPQVGTSPVSGVSPLDAVLAATPENLGGAGAADAVAPTITVRPPSAPAANALSPGLAPEAPPAAPSGGPAAVPNPLGFLGLGAAANGTGSGTDTSVPSATPAPGGTTPVEPPAAPPPSILQPGPAPAPTASQGLAALLADPRPLAVIQAEQQAQAQAEAKAAEEAQKAQEQRAIDAGAAALPPGWSMAPGENGAVLLTDPAGDTHTAAPATYGLAATVQAAVDAAQQMQADPNFQAMLEAKNRRGDGTRTTPIFLQNPSDLAAATSQVATPTPGQAEAGNYRKGHVRVGGLDIAIENPAGSERSGIAPDGTPWSVNMPSDYGYVKASKGADGDQVDVYMGPGAHEAPKLPVFIIDQKQADGSAFDEHKVMLGYPSQDAALHAYHAAFSDGRGHDRVGAVRQVTWQQFRSWLRNGDTSKPFAYKPKAPPKARVPRTGHTKPPSLFEFLAAAGGIRDHKGDLKALGLLKGKFIHSVRRQLIRNQGMSLDRAREAATEAGYLGSDNDTGRTDLNDLLDALDREARGQPVYPHGADYASEAAEQDQREASRKREAAGENQREEVRSIADEIGVPDLTDAEIDAAIEIYAAGEMTLEDALVVALEREQIRVIGAAVAQAHAGGHDIEASTLQELQNAHAESEDIPWESHADDGSTAAGDLPPDAGATAPGQRDNGEAGRTEPQSAGRAERPDAPGPGVAGDRQRPEPAAEGDRGGVAPPTTFKTAKGSTYQVHEDGTTTRDKAYRPEHGPTEQGAQPRSQTTFYVTTEQSHALGEIQTTGPRRVIASVGDGRWGIRYVEGPHAGKFEGRTVLAPTLTPAVGLTPVELWRDGAVVHFGNPIIEVGIAPAPATETVATLDGDRQQGVFDGVKPLTEGERAAADAKKKRDAKTSAGQAEPGGMFSPEVAQVDLVDQIKDQDRGKFGTVAAPNVPALAEAFRAEFAAGRNFATIAQARQFAASKLGGAVLPQTRAAAAVDEALALVKEEPDGRRDDVAPAGNPPPANAGVGTGKPAREEPAQVLGGQPAGDGGPVEEAAPASGDPAGVRPGRPEVSGENDVPAVGDGTDGRGGTGDDGVVDAGTGGSAGVAAPSRPNFHIADPDQLIGGTPKVRFGKNRAAIEALRALEEEQRPPTDDELQAMAAYTGWGSFGQELFQGSWANPRPKAGWDNEDRWLREHLGEAEWLSAQRSIINAHYTDPPTVKAMWEMVQRMGFQGGRILEPSMGIGNFFGLMPPEIMGRSDLTGIELDSLTGAMAKLLYPQANVQIKGYQDSATPDNFYDLVIGNWPFAADGPADRRYDKIAPSLHDYFFLKALDQVRPGGLVVGITSAGTMDKQGRAARMALAEKGDLVASFRLPSGAFEQYAGTKVVTDIIILRKREEPRTNMDGVDWVETGKVEFPAGDINLNNYYQAKPDNILGTIGFGHGTTTFRPGMIVTRPDDFAQRLADLPAQVPEGIYQPAQRKKDPRFIVNNTKDRQNAITIGDDGDLYQVQGERLAALADVSRAMGVKDKKKADQRTAQVKALVKIRQAYGALIDAERDNDPKVEDLRKKLNRLYVAFTKAHGTISKSDGLRIFDAVEDPFFNMLAALERPDGSPASILTEAMTRGARIKGAPSIPEAYVMARNEGMILNMDRVAELAEQSRAAVETYLTKHKAVYRTPGGGFAPSDEYLGGNVRIKLREAQDALARGEDMQASVDALKEVQPKDTPYFQIEAKLGAVWAGEDVARDFIADMLGVSGAAAEDINVRFRRGRWQVVFGDDNLNRREEARVIKGVDFYRFDRLVQAAMSNMVIKIYHKDEEGNRVFDEKQSEEANTKAQLLREEFTAWAWRDPERRVRLERRYNETMNAIAKPHFDGSFLDMSGMALRRGDDAFSLRQHQTNAIWRGVSLGRGLFAHEVGTGKTYTMGGIAVEGRRFGVHRKPLLFAHNANSAAVAREMQEMYPGAKFLYINNLDRSQIKQTIYRIANEDWDAIIMPHSMIDKIGLKFETLMDLARDDIQQLEDEAYEAALEDGETLTPEMFDDEKELKKLRSVTAKQLVKQRQAIIDKIQKMANRATEEGAVNFEDLGVDAVIVDEAHEFKKPPIATRMSVKGLNKGTSNRSIALSLLTGYVRKKRAGKGIYLFTGTPITNSLVEIFNMMRYVMADRMERDGVGDWDAWFNTFADALTEVELTASGEFDNISRLSAFVNTDELVKMASEFTDVVQASDMPEFVPRHTASGKTLLSSDLTDEEREFLQNGRTEKPEGRPYKKIVTDVGEMSPRQREILDHLRQLARDFRDAPRKERRERMLSGDPSSPIIVETNAANASLDARMYDPQAPDFDGSKVNRAARNIMKHYREHPETAQAVFVDRGYDRPRAWEGITDPPPVLIQDLIAKLVAEGIPREQIAVVAGGTSAERKKEIADAVNRAEIRVVIGQSGTLGVGVNMQVNLRAMHHLDAPWRPGDLEQRNGRGERQGNRWNTVLEYRYITEGIDGRRWQVLAAKDRFIRQFIAAFNDTSGKRIGVIEGDAVDVDDSEDNSGILDTLAKAAGDARLQQRAKLRGDVDRLQRRERMHTIGIADAAERARTLRSSITPRRKFVEMWQPALETWAAARERAKKAAEAAGDKKVWNEAVIGGVKVWTNEQIGEALEKAVKEVARGKAAILGTINGLHIYADWKSNPRGDRPEFELRADPEQDGIEINTLSPQSIGGAIAHARLRGQEFPAWRKETHASIARLEAAAKEEFPQEQALAKKRQQLSDLEADLQANPIPPPAWLRNGAPVGASVFVEEIKSAGFRQPRTERERMALSLTLKAKHRTLTERLITGHRSSDDHYVLTDEGPVAYRDALDQYAQPVFTEQEPPRQLIQRRTDDGQAPATTGWGGSGDIDPDARASITPEGWGAIEADPPAMPSAEAIQAAVEAVRGITGGRVNVAVRSALRRIEGMDMGGVAIGRVIRVAMGPRAPWNIHHEAIHALRNMGVLSPAEWNTLKAAAERQGWAKTFGIGTERYQGYDPERAIEEAIAEKFAQWSLDENVPAGGAVRRAWNRAKGFMDRLRNGLAGRGLQTAEDVFGKIGAGEVGQREPGSKAPQRGPQTMDEALGRMAFFDQFEDVPATLEAVLAEARFSLTPRQGRLPVQQPVTFDAPTQNTRLDSAIYRLQDKHIDTKRVLEAIERASGPVDDDADPRLAEELFHRRTAKRIDDFVAHELRPLLAATVEWGVSLADLEEYLHARHAEERNEQIAKINLGMPDGGSGMLTADAQAILAGYTPEGLRDMEALASRVDGIVTGTRSLWLRYGLEDLGMVQRLQRTYPHYVPLQREEMEDTGAPTGGSAQGFSVRGQSTKRALGSERAVVNIIANLAAQREMAIVRGEKNIVANALLQLARDNPNPDFWKIDDPPMIRYLNDTTGLVETRPDPTFKQQDHVVVARMTGQGGRVVEQALIFNRENPRALRMAQAIKSLDMDQLGSVLGTVAIATRFIAKMNTQYNPIFGLVNLIRDTQEGSLNLSSTPIGGRWKQVVAGILPAWWAIYRAERANRADRDAPLSEWVDLWAEFQRVGGPTGYRDVFATSEDRAKRIADEIRRVTEGRARKFGRAIMGWLTDFNESLENAVRLASYKEAKAHGMTQRRAASLAKNLTVNFHRTGQVTAQMGAFYAFFNAQVQGVARNMQALAGPAGKAIIAGGILLGAMQQMALEAAGFDEHDIPSFVRERNTILPIGGKKFLTVPMPLGFMVLPNIGRVGTEVLMDGGRDAGKKLIGLVRITADAFNPFGSASPMQMIAPTVADPIAALSENQDWTGRRIARPNISELDPKPGHARAKENATEFSRLVARGLNYLTFGTEAKEGALSPTPDQIDYLIGQYTGGVGRELVKVWKSVSGAVTGDEVPPHNVPLVGRFYGSANTRAAASDAFYENIKALNAHQAEIMMRAKTGKDAAAYMRANPEALLFRMADQVQRSVNDLQKRRRLLVEQKGDKAAVKALDDAILGRMQVLNDAVKKAQGK